jgi:prepilin-type N-terminal cleavage/methylation domain-containing protein
MTFRVARDRGFTFVELLVALAILLTVLGGVLYLSDYGQRLSRAQPEAADLQQRVRVVADMLQRDLMMAGAGPLHGRAGGALTNYFAPVVPARTGARSPDPELSWFRDRISIVYVPDGGWQAGLSADMVDAGSDVPLAALTPGCPSAGLCGFSEGTRAVLLDTAGVGLGHELFTVTGTAAGLAHGSPNAAFSRPYAATTGVVMPIVQRVYHFDASTRRLMLYDGYQSDMPLVDNVVDVNFRYYADPSPASIPQSSGGSCVSSPGIPPTLLLADLGGRALRPLTPDQLRDGPVCGLSPNRFDGDLLRIRRVQVTLRFDVAAGDLRGSGASFGRPGTATSVHSYVRDYEVTFDVTPRNLLPTR